VDKREERHEEEPESESQESETETATATAERKERAAPEPAGGNGDGRVKASPVARRMAEELGVELARLEGSGPGGRIVKADVEAAARGDGKTRERPAEGDGAAPERAPE